MIDVVAFSLYGFSPTKKTQSQSTPIQSVDRLIHCLGCFWIKFKNLKPVAKQELVNLFPIILVQISMCNEKAVTTLILKPKKRSTFRSIPHFLIGLVTGYCWVLHCGRFISNLFESIFNSHKFAQLLGNCRIN